MVADVGVWVLSVDMFVASFVRLALFVSIRFDSFRVVAVCMASVEAVGQRAAEAYSTHYRIDSRRTKDVKSNWSMMTSLRSYRCDLSSVSKIWKVTPVRNERSDTHSQLG